MPIPSGFRAAIHQYHVAKQRWSLREDPLSGALITYRNETMPLQLLKSSERAVDPRSINNSVNNLEYEFSHILRRITSDKSPHIAIIQGHGESSLLETSDAQKLLEESYPVERVTIDGQLNSLTFAVDESGK